MKMQALRSTHENRHLQTYSWNQAWRLLPVFICDTAYYKKTPLEAMNPILFLLKPPRDQETIYMENAEAQILEKENRKSKDSG